MLIAIEMSLIPDPLNKHGLRIYVQYVYTYLHMHTHMHTHIYIYFYIYSKVSSHWHQQFQSNTTEFILISAFPYFLNSLLLQWETWILISSIFDKSTLYVTNLHYHCFKASPSLFCLDLGTLYHQPTYSTLLIQLTIQHVSSDCLLLYALGMGV